MRRPHRRDRFPAPAIDKFLYLARALHDCQSRCVLTFSGSVDIDRLAQAIRLSIAATPILGCRFVAHRWRPYWQLQEEPEQIAQCPVCYPENLEREQQQFLAGAMDPCRDALVQMRLFRTDHDILCLKMHHMTADAGGMLEFIRLLGRLYHRLADPEAPSDDIDSLKSRGQWQALRQAGAKALLRGCLSYRLPRAAWGLAAQENECPEKSFALRRFSAGHSAAIKAYCQAQGVSMDSVLHAAFYHALFELLDPPPGLSLPIQATINLRRYLPGTRAHSICNLAGVYFPSITSEPGATFASTLRRVHAVLEREKSRQSWLGGALLLESAFALGFAPAQAIAGYLRQRKISSSRLHPFFANIGNIKQEQIEFGDVALSDIALFGPVPYPPASIVSVHSFQNALMVTTGFCHSGGGENPYEKLLDLYVATLSRL